MEAFWLNVRTNPDIDVDKALADMNKLVQSIFDGNIPATPTK
jgi:hypothetical protein